MKKSLLIISIFFTVLAFGQKNEFNLIKLDSTWGQEVLRFPARNMNYIGIGDVRFPPKGWIQPTHKNFWSYTYAWNINVNRKITEKELEIDLVKYFNSLNKIEMNDTSNNKYSSAKVNKIRKEGDTTFFKGRVAIFDRFATNKEIILNVKIESHYYRKKKRTILLFKFSPKGFKHETWEMLEKVKLHSNL
mgnify:CR=1 FL=1